MKSALSQTPLLYVYESALHKSCNATSLSNLHHCVKKKREVSDSDGLPQFVCHHIPN